MYILIYTYFRYRINLNFFLKYFRNFVLIYFFQISENLSGFTFYIWDMTLQLELSIN